MDCLCNCVVFTPCLRILSRLKDGNRSSHVRYRGRNGGKKQGTSVLYLMSTGLNTLLVAIYQQGIKRRYYPDGISWRWWATYPSGSAENFSVAPINVPRRRFREDLTAIVCSRKYFVHGGQNDDCKSS